MVEHAALFPSALPLDTGVKKLGKHSKALLCPVCRLSSIKQKVVDES